jgi:hypothetical protein
MAYKTKQTGRIRDVCYPSVIAHERPLLATRLTWEENEESPDDMVNRGGEGESRLARFNRQLREGHAGRNHGEE